MSTPQVPAWIPAPGLQLVPTTPDPRTSDRLNAARSWLAVRGIYGPRSLYLSRVRVGTVRVG